MKILRPILIFYIIAGIIILPVQYAYSEKKEALTLDLLVGEALANNPDIQSAYNEWKAAEYKVTYVKGLPDPIANYTYFGDSIQTKTGPQEHKYGISQKIPFPGKLSLKGKSQNRHADILREGYEAARREVIKDIKFLYYDIFWVDKAIQITEEEKIIMESLERVAEMKYESNLVPQQDVVKAQVEITKLIDKLLLLKQHRASIASRMNSLLNRPRDIEIGAIRDIEPVEFKYELEQLRKISKESRQELLAAKLDIERAEYETSLAKLDYFPDFTFGVDYVDIGGGNTTDSNDGQDAWMGKVSINLPIWFGKLDSQVKEKKALLASRKMDYKNVENNLDYEVEDLYFKITTYRDIASLYKTALVPQAEHSFESTRIGYETGKVDFLNWLDSERVLLQTRLAYYKIITDYEKSIVYLERVVGKDL